MEMQVLFLEKSMEVMWLDVFLGALAGLLIGYWIAFKGSDMDE